VEPRTVVVTGANSGIGFEVALRLARDGARVVMACRNLDKGRAALDRIARHVPSAELALLRLDVADLESVRLFAEELAQRVEPIDTLVNNAGVAVMPLSRTAAGHELQLATNYLGTFALTGLVLPRFRRDRPTRIVNVGSLAHRFGSPAIDDLNWEAAPYDPWKAYARSKLALVSFTLELDRRLRDSQSNIAALAAHPGFAVTEIHTKSERLASKSALGRWFKQKMQAVIPAAVDAARPISFAASANHVSGGEYYGPGGFLEIGGKPARARMHPATQDMSMRRRLWSISESMSGVRYLSDL
jgi:NAD(P)-dependent dehydrogenase (short-subunit alcohol dehydrogenase family)